MMLYHPGVVFVDTLFKTHHVVVRRKDLGGRACGTPLLIFESVIMEACLCAFCLISGSTHGRARCDVLCRVCVSCELCLSRHKPLQRKQIKRVTHHATPRCTPRATPRVSPNEFLDIYLYVVNIVIVTVPLF